MLPTRQTVARTREQKGHCSESVGQDPGSAGNQNKDEDGEATADELRYIQKGDKYAGPGDRHTRLYNNTRWGINPESDERRS